MALPNLEGFQEFFSDGVINPELSSLVFQSESKKYKKLTERVYLLYAPPAKEPEFDIVFIHGIGSDEFMCWSTKKKLLWPAAFVPQDFPTARVITVGYEHSLWNWKSAEEKEEEKQKIADILGEEEVKNTNSAKEEAPKEALMSAARVSEKTESSWKNWWGDGKDEKTAMSAKKPLESPVVAQERKRGPLEELLAKDPSELLPLEGTQTTKQSTDSESLRSFRRVGANIADRLVSAEVGVGQRPVVFITHSMGGLITKEMLVALFQSVSSTPSWSSKNSIALADSADPAEKALLQAGTLLRATRGVVFYGTPHFGSGVASVVTGLQRYYQSLGGLTPTNVVTGLGDHNRDELHLLNDLFMEVVERVPDQTDCPTTKEEAGVRTMSSRRAANMSILSFGETRKLNGLVRVVEPESANPCPDDPRFSFYLIDADHCQVNRPETKTAPSYAMLYGFLDRLQQKGELGGRQAALLRETLPVVSVTAERKQSQTPGTVFTEAEWQHLIEQWRSTVTTQSDLIENNTNRGELKYLSHYYSRYPLHTTFLMLQELDNALAELRRTVGRFFGRVVPPELDGILLLGADVKEFTLNSFGPLAQQTNTTASSSMGTLMQSFLLSVMLPCNLLLYWTRHTCAMIVNMERRQLERTVALMTTAILPEGSVIPHLSSEDTRDLAEVEREVSVLKGEWESFRHSISVRLRRQQQQKANDGVALWEQLSGKERWLTEQHLHVLFFMQSARSVLTKEVHDGGCLSDLIGHYLEMVFRRVSQYETEVLQSTFSELVPSEKTIGNLLSDDRSSSSGGSPFTFVFTEGLEAYLSLGINDEKARDMPVPSQESNACVLPALSAASCFMLGYVFSINGDAYFSDHQVTCRSHYKHALAAVRSWRNSMNQLDSKARAQTPPKSSPRWWDSSKERQAKDNKQWEGRKYDSDVLTSAFELVIHTFLTLSYWQEAEAAGGLLSFVDCAPDTITWCPLGDHAQLAIKEAQRAYSRCDRLLSGGGVQDLNRPFSPAAAAAAAVAATATGTEGGGSPSGKPKTSGDDAASPRESLAKVKESFLESLKGLLSEMDPPENAAVTKQKASKKAKPSATFSASSIPSFFISSLVNAWDAVRRGGEVPETPKYFAQNALLFWWVVEEHWGYSFDHALHLSARNNAKPQNTFLQAAYKDFLKTKQAPPESGLSPSASATAAPQKVATPNKTTDRTHPQETYRSAHNSLRSQWATACGWKEVAHVWRTLYLGEGKNEEERVQAAREAPLRIPVALTRALELDRGNALAHCLVGNFLVLRDSLSPDAAHPYHAVLRIEKSPRRPLYRAAAAALGWVHLRQVNTAVPFRLSTVVGGEGELLVQDPLAQRSAAGPYQQFLEAVVSQVRARTVVQEEAHRPPNLLPLWQEVTTYHLDLAEQYFSTVLEEDPEHPGALCGLGRLHTLAVDAPHEATGRGSLSSSRYASLAPRLVGRVPRFDLAARYFQAALGDTPLDTKRSCTADRMLDAMFASFAAHWLGDLARPDLLTAQHLHGPTASQLSEQLSELQSARDACEAWYRQSLALFPMNDWTLTSLGLLQAQGYGVSDPQHGEGLDLLEKSLLLNPRNEWTQWGLAVYGRKESLRLSSAASLQKTLMKSLFRIR